jgi:hypothetical protein
VAIIQGKGCLRVLACLMLFASESYGVDKNNFRLDVEKNKSDKIEITASVTGVIPLTVIANQSADEQSFELRINDFIGENGDSLSIELIIPDTNANKTDYGYSGIKPEQGLIYVQLKVPESSVSGNYTGSLFLLSDKGGLLRDWRIVIKPAVDKYSTLIVGRNAITKNVVLPATPEIPVQLWEKSGKQQVNGIFIRTETLNQEDTTELDWNQQLSFKFNDRLITDIDQTQSLTEAMVKPESLRNISAGGQATLQIGLKNLEAGRYGVALRLGALNSLSDDKQSLILTVLVKDPLVYAVIVLFVAIILSYVSTKGLTMVRQRLSLFKRIRELRPAWLYNEPPVTPVIWYIATLKQAEDRIRKRILSAAEVDGLLEKVQRMYPLLEKIRILRLAVNDSAYDPMIKLRARQAIDNLVQRLGRVEYTIEVVDAFTNELNALVSWSDYDLLKPHYCMLVEKSIEQLLTELHVKALEKAVTKSVKDKRIDSADEVEINVKLKEIVEKLGIKPTAVDLTISLERERNYAWLKLLWQRRDKEEFAEIVKIDPQYDLDKIFMVADRAVWKRIKSQKEKLKFTLPKINKGSPPEAYNLIPFGISTGDKFIDDSYLFNYGLMFHWTINIAFKNKKEPFTLNPQTKEPRVIQFSPLSGYLSASVKIHYENDEETVSVKMEEPLLIKSAGFFRLLKSFESTEMAALFIASGIALVTGLMNFYYKNNTFGSAQDYISLFLWGVGIDQTKNFLQTLQQFSSSGGGGQNST